MVDRERRRSPERLLIASITLFFLSAFLLLALKDMKPMSFLMAVLVPLILFGSTMVIPRLFPADQLLLAMVNFLCALGVLVLYRLSPQQGINQALNYGVGILAMILCMFAVRLIRQWRLVTLLLVIFSLVLMVLPVLFGAVRNGAKAWINVAGIGFQPSEIVKISLLAIEAYLLSRRKMVMAGLFAGLCLILLMLQMDLGTALIYYGVTLIMLYAATRSYSYLGIGVLGGMAGAWYGYSRFSHVKRRVRIWLDPWSDSENASYQIVKSLVAMVNGGVWGMGLGLGNAGGIPASQTDFIYSVILNEFGLIFGVCVLMIYVLVFVRGIGVALRAHSRFHTLLALGASVLIALQTFIIIGGNIKMIPLTGVTLPFISYGGSSILSSFGIMGLLQGVASINDDEMLRAAQLAGAGEDYL